MGEQQLPASTPVLVGAGQLVRREAGDESPTDLASNAAKLALTDTGADNIQAHIDTICFTRLFSDMGHLWPCKFGRSDNPPESVAQAIGAKPRDRIYTATGGNEPQSRLIEFAADIARGEREVVMLVGAEALKNQRSAERQQLDLDWNEQFPDAAMDDRETGIDVATSQEMNNGLMNVMYYFALIEQAQRHKAGQSVQEHQQEAANLLANFSEVAENNPHAQFTGRQTAEDILTAPPLTHLYTKRMIAQDSVNQAAAVLVCSIGKAQELGIDESRWIYLHGLAEGKELQLSHRSDPAHSAMADKVLDRALQQAAVQIDDIALIDIYSCFPCAVNAIANSLHLPRDGSRPLTLTGGLPYFGGPGNNYSMHALVEAVWRGRAQPLEYSLVTANGGMLSKHAVGVFSSRPSTVNWATADTQLDPSSLEKREICLQPDAGKILSYTVNYGRDGEVQAIILGETVDGERFVATTAPDDNATATDMLNNDPTGRPVTVESVGDERLHFTLVGAQTN